MRLSLADEKLTSTSVSERRGEERGEESVNGERIGKKGRIWEWNDRMYTVHRANIV